MYSHSTERIQVFYFVFFTFRDILWITVVHPVDLVPVQLKQRGVFNYNLIILRTAHRR